MFGEGNETCGPMNVNKKTIFPQTPNFPATIMPIAVDEMIWLCSFNCFTIRKSMSVFDDNEVERNV
jgi:hypothetical protein